MRQLLLPRPMAFTRVNSTARLSPNPTKSILCEYRISSIYIHSDVINDGLCDSESISDTPSEHTPHGHRDTPSFVTTVLGLRWQTARQPRSSGFGWKRSSRSARAKSSEGASIALYTRPRGWERTFDRLPSTPPFRPSWANGGAHILRFNYLHGLASCWLYTAGLAHIRIFSPLLRVVHGAKPPSRYTVVHLLIDLADV